MKYFVKYEKIGVDLNVSENPTNEELVFAFLGTFGPQEAFAKIMNKMIFIKDDTQEVEHTKIT